MRLSLSFLLFCAFALFTLSSCGDELLEDPIMTAKVNGRDFTACRGSGKNISLPSNNVSITYTTDGRLKIAGTDSCNDTIRQIKMEIINVQGAGTYTLDQQWTALDNYKNTAALLFLYSRPANLNGLLSTDAQHTGTITISNFDLTNRRLSAEFEIDVYEPNSGILYRIREGRLKNAPF